MTKRVNPYGNLALVFIVCGVSAVGFALFASYNTATRPWNSFSIIESVDSKLFGSALPAPEEWPLAVARTAAESDGKNQSNRYTVEIEPIRGTELLRLDVIGRSPERTTAFGLWLSNSFAHDFSNSLAKRGILTQRIGPPVRILNAPTQAIPLRLHPAGLILSLITPLLLVTCGILLLRASKINLPVSPQATQLGSTEAS